ncbi:MAG: choice-of-anchor D domain-containing protein [Anaerolineae bacterium]|nr:choice-of-anchor D domain-containing protein [Anaerolineae bacterium]
MASTQLDLSTTTAAVIQENSGQIAIGQYVVQIGSIHGGVVNVAMPEEQVHWQPRLVPVLLRPRRFSGLLDRQRETGAATAAVHTAQPVEFYGPPGLGKTSLLRHLAYNLPLSSCTDGIVYLSVQQQPLADLLQFLFEAFYESNIPAKATEAQIRHGLQGKQALILLDDVDLARPEVEAVLDAAPDCAFVFTSAERRLWGEGQVLALGGLPLDDALALLEREIARPLSQEELPAAKELCQILAGHPLRLLQVAALAQEHGPSLVELRQRLQQALPAEALTRQLLNQLSPPERRVLGMLALFGGAPLGHEHVVALTGLPEITPVIETLLQRNLIQAHSPRYSLSGDLAQQWPSAWDLTPLAERALGYFTRWAEQAQSTPDRLLEEAGAIRQLLAWAVETQRWPETLRLVRVIEGAFSLSGRWATWAEILQSGLQAAEALGDRAAKAWAWHQLGTRALCLDDKMAARTALSRALRLRETLGDYAGADITRHNLNLLLGPPPPQSPSTPPAPNGTPGTPWPLFGLIGFSLLLLLAVGGWLGSTLLASSPRPAAVQNGPPTLTRVSEVSFVPTATFTPIPAAPNVPPATFTPTLPLPTDTPTPLPSPTPTATASPTPIPTFTFTVSPTPIPTFTPTATSTPSSTPTATPRPVALLDPMDLNFGSIRVAEASRTETVRLINTGGGLLTVSNIFLEGNAANDYLLESSNCLARSGLPANSSCIINLRFRPTATGERRASLTILTNSLDSPGGVFLTGFGLGDPAANLNPVELAWGEQPIGSTSEAQTVHMTNVGQGDLTINSVNLGGTHLDDFTFEEGCANFVLQPGDSCLISVRFTPRAAGQRTAELILTDNAPDTPQHLPLRGIGAATQPDLVVSALDFNGPAQINRRSGEIEVPIRLAVRNHGNAEAGLFKVSTDYTGPNGTFVVAFTVPGQNNIWYPFTNTPLPPGDEVVFAGVVTFSANMQGQNVSLTGLADSCSGDEFMPPACRVEESREDNNLSQPISLALPTPPPVIE